jgi:hypothetical protein
MATFKKKKLDELVGGDYRSDGGDINPNSSEIETGPVHKTYDDESDYEKGVSTTTDKVFGRYRQNIPWFAVYSFGGSRTGGLPINYGQFNEETKSTILKKKTVEEKIEDLVKKSKPSDVSCKDCNPKVDKVLDEISELDLNEKQIEELISVLNDKKNKSVKNKNI